MEQETQGIRKNEITLKEVIFKFKEYKEEIRSNWIPVFLLMIITSSVLLFLAFRKPVYYNAELTFMINEEDGNSIGGISAILGQIGVGGGGKGKNKIEKILELAQTRKIIQSVLFEKVVIQDRNDFLANHIILLYDLHAKWAKSEIVEKRDFLFTRDSLSDFSRVENGVLLELYYRVIGSEAYKPLFKSNTKGDAGVMIFEVKTISEYLSYYLCNIIYEKLSTFYVDKAIEKQYQTFVVMEEKVDSVRSLMLGKEYNLAAFLDANRGLLNRKDQLKELQLKREINILNEMYGVSLKNFEIADFTLKNKTPYVQLIDEPIIPLSIQEESIKKALVFGLILGFLLGIFLIAIRKLFRDALLDL